MCSSPAPPPASARRARSGWHAPASTSSPASARKPTGRRVVENGVTGRITPVIIDVVDAASIAAAREQIAGIVGERGLAGLVNNAGISIAGPLEVLPIERFKQQMDVNVNGQVAVTQAFLPLVRKAKGRIVNMGSIGGRMASPFLGALQRLEVRDGGDLRLPPPGAARRGASTSRSSSRAASPRRSGTSRSALSEEIEREIPPEGAKLYRKQIDAMRKAADEIGKGGIPADEVAKVVEHALTASKPKTRYVVGREAKIQAIAVEVPARPHPRSCHHSPPRAAEQAVGAHGRAPSWGSGAPAYVRAK